MDRLAEHKKIILFDGICNLCNDAVIFIIRHDKKDKFRFASLQSSIGQKLLEERGMDPNYRESIILIDPGVAWFDQSDAALEVLKDLTGPLSFLHYLHYLPKNFRDLIYRFIARNRYHWFGKSESCMIPTPELNSKFLD